MLRTLGGVLLACFITLPAVSQAEMFGRHEVKYEDIREFRKWKEVVKKNEADMIFNDEVTRKWKQDIAEIKDSATTRAEKIKAVNKYVNKMIAYKSDQEVWGVSDYWASPTEAMTRGEGDCEDYAIAKYFSLKMLGFEDDEMRVVVLKDTRKNELHAILAVDGENGHSRSYVLDNQTQSVLMDTQIAYYAPIYSINVNNWWKHS